MLAIVSGNIDDSRRIPAGSVLHFAPLPVLRSHPDYEPNREVRLAVFAVSSTKSLQDLQTKIWISGNNCIQSYTPLLGQVPILWCQLTAFFLLSLVKAESSDNSHLNWYWRRGLVFRFPFLRTTFTYQPHTSCGLPTLRAYHHTSKLGTVQSQVSQFLVQYLLPRLSFMMSSPVSFAKSFAEEEEERELQKAVAASLAPEEDIQDAIRASISSAPQTSMAQLAPATSDEEQAQQV